MLAFGLYSQSSSFGTTLVTMLEQCGEVGSHAVDNGVERRAGWLTGWLAVLWAVQYPVSHAGCLLGRVVRDGARREAIEVHRKSASGEQALVPGWAYAEVGCLRKGKERRPVCR